MARSVYPSARPSPGSLGLPPPDGRERYSRLRTLSRRTRNRPLPERQRSALVLRFYVQRFSDYNAAYGSIGGVILLVLWLYLSSAVLLLGAEINAEIEQAAAAQGEATAKAEGERRAA